MNPVLTPFFLPTSTVAGWLERHQREVVEYLIDENRTLEQQLGQIRLRLDDHPHRRLAAKGNEFGCELLPH